MNAVPIPKIPLAEHRQPSLANEQNIRNELEITSELESSLGDKERAPSPPNQELDPGHNPEDASDEEDEVNESHLEHLRVSQKFLRAISIATLDDGKLNASVVDELRNPQKDPPNELQDPDVRHSLNLFIACKHASQKTYKSVCETIKH